MTAVSNSMSMKDLRRELDAMGIDYSNCLEKVEMTKLFDNTHKGAQTARGAPRPRMEVPVFVLKS